MEMASLMIFRVGETLTVQVELGFICALPPDPSSIACASVDCSFAKFFVEAKRDCGQSFKEFPEIEEFDIIDGATFVGFNGETLINNSFFGSDFGTVGNAATCNPLAPSIRTVEFCYIHERENVEPCPATSASSELQVVFSGSSIFVYDLEFVAGSGEVSVNGVTTTSGATGTIPVAVCDEVTVIAINEDGASRVPALVFDDGSLDACDELVACVARMDEVEYFRNIKPDTFINNLPYVLKINFEFSCHQDEVEGMTIEGNKYISEADLCRPFVKNCCTDAETENRVMFQVSDPAENSNRCMTNVEIQDMAVIAFGCPEDVTIDCQVDYDPCSIEVIDCLLSWSTKP